MDTSPSLPKRKHIKIDEDIDYADLYRHDLSLYQNCPSDDIALSNFFDYAYDRMQVLRVLEYASLIGYKICAPEWKTFVIQELKKLNLDRYIIYLQVGSLGKTKYMQFLHEDNVGHHVLKSILCKTEELRKWFLNRELELFNLRLAYTSHENIVLFMKANKLTYTLLSIAERDKLRDEINCSTAGNFLINSTPFYKVPGNASMPLLQEYKVFIKNGIAYVPNYAISTCIISVFQNTLRANLVHCSERISQLNDERFSEFKQLIDLAYAGKIYDGKIIKFLGQVNLSNLNKCAAESFPLCMRVLHDTFRTDHHLKHLSRLQYMFFLKGLGMVYEDVMQLWREEFTKNMDEVKFEKEYAYSVKHAFGKVGRMQSHPAYNCAKIISNPACSTDTHGCPYKRWDADQLKAILKELGLTSDTINAILVAKQEGNYQVACGKYFRFMHGQNIQNPLHHPNQYFENSFDLKNKEHGNSKLDLAQSAS